MNRFPMISILLAGLLIISLASGCNGPGKTSKGPGISPDDKDAMADSIVFLNISAYVYEQLQPWKQPDLANRAGYGIAVGPHLILTTASNTNSAALIKARRFGQNEFIPAKVKVIDYEANLCLLELDAEALREPMTPVEFIDEYEQGTQLASYWLSGSGEVTTGRGYLDRAEVVQSSTSYSKMLNFVAANTVRDPARGQLYTVSNRPIGIACWADTDAGETGLIPAGIIMEFLAEAAGENYAGFATMGFEAMKLLDPTRRRNLNVPENVTDGIYVSKVRGMGTGSNTIRPGDVIVSIDGMAIDAHGRYNDDRFGRIAYQHLITRHKADQAISMAIWRNGKKEDLEAQASNFRSSNMFVPYYEYGKQPAYIVTGGFVIQRLTRPYLAMWGDDWSGKVPPHLYEYYRNSLFDPSEDRMQIVVLSYVLPHEISLGYHSLGRLVITKINGIEISSLEDVPKALQANPDAKFNTIEFEQDQPTVVIPRDRLEAADVQISQLYGISELSNLE